MFKDYFLKVGFTRSLTKLSLLGSLIMIAGCSGSKLGDTVGKSLEPDPQLAENAEVTATETPEAATRPRPSQSDTVETVPDPKPDPPVAQAPEEPKVTGGDYTDLAKAPEEIQPYLVDLLELNLLEVRPPTAPPASPPATTPSNSEQSSEQPKAKPPTPPGPDEFRPNQAITRREYARWLLAANNRFYRGQPSRKIRPGVTSSQPVFQDVKANDSDFGAIQGLAEAGIIPSPLTGSSTTVTFRPDAPLTRKDLLLWKVPLDTRSPLPQATPAAVEQAWGFQDAAKIEPRALQAVLADYQNGDFANIRRAFSYTTLFQPDKAATRAEAAAVLWRFGNSTEGITAEEILNPTASTQAETSDSP
ncbi:MAG: S-layer homology domain-containing protein [Phormidesmis sp.]